MTKRDLLEKVKEFETRLGALLEEYGVAICAEKIGPEHDRKIDLYLDFMGGLACLNLARGTHVVQNVGNIESVDINYSKLEYIEK